MTYAPLKARHITEVGTRAWLRVFWDHHEIGHIPSNTCPNAWGKGKPGYHEAMVFLSKTSTLEDWELGGDPKDYAEFRWPAKCDNCDADAPPPQHVKEDQAGLDVIRHIHRKRLYNTASGNPEPGDLYWANWYHRGDDKCWIWDNCKGPHLIAVLPNGCDWDIDSRASNCTLPEDRVHRCWIRIGEPPDITISKAGPTCSAGAGSIAARDYHGFLQEGTFTAG